ncbi:NADH dehydrogenase [ubiquinone] iron-sulfur protein 5-like [Culicoides brevitarsis]|uniref:NADH dehydrogenase [ubiquinone] iron-sulfur protein 5-like n=1 Tax=Culicoides brevitarsis TaxID=469753 RepID=UPI00307C7BD4
MVTPLIKTPFTDLTSGIINCQYYDKCGERELAMTECLEAYGLERGKKKCADLIADFQECFTMKKQLLRVAEMKMERERQYWMGERSKEERYAKPPRMDAY